MIISHRKKFIFIHNYKVAGTSVREALRPYNCKSFILSSFEDKLNLILGKYPKIYTKDFEIHINGPDLKKRLPAEVFDNYFKFGFVRNPWDWQVSLYKYMLKRETHHQHEFAKSLKDFDEYIRWRVENEVRLQKAFFYIDDTCIVDYIGKMENLQEDFEEISKKVNINTKLNHLNASRKASDDYLKYYTQETLDLVAEAFKVDIELFGYEKPVLKN